ncbi:hypothetical protein [Flavobacterium okayamense]|uniref:Uncharacterized protein n=1 Tax=Flavobacterium okayamense TaxID=2830782 RepID=A0ABN6HX98_9FLAO|nr:hypothetical protein [Flavobacterium okayamense]BCY28926.1 hypothetical protein KK2020170_17940 [Flavobacterium okayamense]
MNLNLIFDILKNEIQEIIDALALKNHDLAEEKVIKLSEKIADLIDNTTNEDFLREISKYQILLEHLKSKL